MMPVRVLDLPSGICKVVGGSFQLVPEGEFFTGQWTPTIGASGARNMRWMADIELAPLIPGDNGDLRFKWESFVARLQGTTNAFRLWDPLRVRPRGAGAGRTRGSVDYGAFLVDGTYHIDSDYVIEGGSDHCYVRDSAARYADVIVLTGLTPSAVAFKDGDHISIGDNLYMVIDDAIADANGDAAVRFMWKLWKPAIAGDRVNLYRPSGRFVLRERDGGAMSRNHAAGTVTISAIEAPDVG